MISVSVGDVCVMQRTSVGGMVEHQHEAVVTKITAKRAYVGRDYFALAGTIPAIVKPRYLDTVTRAVAIRRAVLP